MEQEKPRRRSREQIDLSKIQFSEKYIESFFKWISYNAVLAVLAQTTFRLWIDRNSWFVVPMLGFTAVVTVYVLAYGLRALALPRAGMTPEQFNDPNADVGQRRKLLFFYLLTQFAMQGLFFVALTKAIPALASRCS